MSKFDSVYGGRWLKACDLDSPRRLQVDVAEWKEVGRDREEKLVLSFTDRSKPLILNSTNARALADAWGKSEQTWQGRWLKAESTETPFGPGIRVKPSEPPAETGDVPF